jgi:hypothetical protein
VKHTKKTALTAAVLTAAMSLVSCTGGDDDMQTVYGPPPTSGETTTIEMQTEYGPPPAADETEASETETAPAETTGSAETTAQNMQVVYGPPNNIS